MAETFSGNPSAATSARNDHDALKQMEQAVAPHISVDDTIRVKLLDACGMTCTFCHNEGTPVANKKGFQAHRVSIYEATNGIKFLQTDITADHADSFVGELDKMQSMGFARELHWTGGEPTLSKHILPLTQAAAEHGYEVKMTSNGQSGARQLEQLKAAGLSGVNFSIFGTTPQELAQTQADVFRDNLLLAEARLKKMGEAMVEACRVGLNVKANIVISGHEDIPRGLRILDQAPDGVKVRFQADTSMRVESLDAIHELMSTLGAHPVARELVAGCSIDNFDYELPSGDIVTYKQTRESRLKDICSDCTLNNPDDCHEGYYGVRMYRAHDGEYWYSACIQRMETAQPSELFFGADGLARAIMARRTLDRLKLERQYATV